MNFIVLDLEATCWQGNAMDREQEIIEIAAYCVNGYREWVDSYQRFIKPTLHPRLSSYCIELTSITQDVVNKSKPFDIVFPEFLDWMDNLDQPQLFCTWGAKDMEIIEDECRRHDIALAQLPKSINLKSQYAEIHHLGREVGLLKALEYSEIDFTGEHHRAIDDAYNTAHLFLRYLDQWQY